MINYDDITAEDLRRTIVSAERTLTDIRAGLNDQAIAAARRGDFSAERNLNMARDAIIKARKHLRFLQEPRS